MANQITQNKTTLVLACWALTASGLLLAALYAIPFSHRFGYDSRVIDMPIIPLFLALLLLGGLFVLQVPLIGQSLQVFDQIKNRRHARKIWQILLFCLFATGLLARLAMLFTQPMLEDDYQRYLWDGALTANGHNPYQLSPQDIYEGTSGEPELDKLGHQSGLLLGRINHPELRTIYPPVAQIGFAISYWLKPFSLNAWRLVIIACELASLALLVSLLKKLNRPRLWAALYWLNPLVIKELMNAGHMEGLLVPLLLGAFWASLHNRATLSAFLLALAVGVKIWPALLLPLYLRADLATPKKLILPVLVFSGLLVLMAVPILIAGVDQGSGFVAYAQNWKTNSALFPALEIFMQKLFSLFLSNESAPQTGSLFARFLIAMTLAVIALCAAWRRSADGQDLARKTLLIATAMFLLSPAQFPWYGLWVIPFVVFNPVVGLALLVPALQVYYLSFYFSAHDTPSFYKQLTLWIAWTPVWATLAYHMIRSRSNINSAHNPVQGDGS